MREILYRFAKWVYSFLFRFKWARRLKTKLKKVMRRKQLERQKKFISSFCETYRNTTAEEADFTLLSSDTKSGKYVFGFDALGLIRGIGDYDCEAYCDCIDDILENDDINVRIALTTQEEIDGNREAFAVLEKRLRLLPLVSGQAYMVETEAVKIAFIAFSVARERETREVKLEEKLVRQIAYALNHGADYIVGYCMREENPSVSSTSHERDYLREVANLGVRYIFGANACGIYNGGNLKRIGGGFTDAIISMGCLFGAEEALDENGRNAAVAIRAKIVDSGDGRLIVNKGYIPLYNYKDEKPYERTIRIDYHNSEHTENKEILGALSYIEEATGKLRDIRNILTIQDICDTIGVQLPERYAKLANVSIGKVCMRSFEVDSGDAFFFKEPFQDPNDGEPAPLSLRIRSVESALERGARFVVSYVPLDPEIPHVVMENVKEAHIAVCARLRKNYAVRTIGITGSIGKTSTKDMLYNVLAEKYETYRNLRNSNTQVNIGLHIQSFRGRYEVFIQEIGGGRPGGASRHSRMILPEATVVTNIGLAHIGNYGTQEKLMESKLGIVDGMGDNGTLYLNGDDEYLITAKPSVRTVYYAVHNHDADYYADNIVERQGMTTFDIIHGDHRVSAKLNVLGEYNVLNAVCCYAIGRKFKLTDEEIVRGIAKFETSGTRQNLISAGGYKLFVDCFNASPASIESSLEVLDAMETDYRKIAVIGDVTGTGEATEEIHEDIGEIVKRHHMDRLVCYGEQAKAIHRKCLEAGIDSISMTTGKELNQFLRTEVAVGDVVLFKGSSKNKLALRIDQVYGTMLNDQSFIDKHKYKEMDLNGVKYYAYEPYASAIVASKTLKEIKVISGVRGVKVRNIADGAFADQENAVNLKLASTIRHIGAGSFINCGSLTKVIMPRGLLYIDECAFSGCRELNQVTLNRKLRHIGPRAFENCVKLESIEIPAAVTEIGAGAFAGCSNLTVRCHAGSYAERYCRENGVEYQLLEAQEAETITEKESTGENDD